VLAECGADGRRRAGLSADRLELDLSENFLGQNFLVGVGEQIRK
jgi:hypothetical protein